MWLGLRSWQQPAASATLPACPIHYEVWEPGWQNRGSQSKASSTEVAGVMVLILYIGQTTSRRSYFKFVCFFVFFWYQTIQWTAVREESRPFLRTKSRNLSLMIWVPFCDMVGRSLHISWGRTRRKWAFPKRQIWVQYNTISMIFWKWNLPVIWSLILEMFWMFEEKEDYQLSQMMFCTKSWNSCFQYLFPTWELTKTPVSLDS